MSERFVGRYEVREKIGVGASGTVYRGADGKKTVALKLIGKDKVDEAALWRLKESAPALAQLRHPVIASFLDLFETDKAICVVTQLAPGTSLASQLKQGAWPDPRHVWDIARQILDALALAHGRGVFHGGITPSNILIDDGENVTLTDFGLADLVRSRAPEFMARAARRAAGRCAHRSLPGRGPRLPADHWPCTFQRHARRSDPTRAAAAPGRSVGAQAQDRVAARLGHPARALQGPDGSFRHGARVPRRTAPRPAGDARQAASAAGDSGLAARARGCPRDEAGSRRASSRQLEAHGALKPAPAARPSLELGPAPDLEPSPLTSRTVIAAPPAPRRPCSRCGG